MNDSLIQRASQALKKASNNVTPEFHNDSISLTVVSVNQSVNLCSAKAQSF